MVNLKNPDLDLIRSILIECGYFGFMIRFWISPKKRKILFWIFPKKRTIYVKFRGTLLHTKSSGTALTFFKWK